MNALQISPLGAIAPPASPGKDPPPDVSTSSKAARAAPKADIGAPEAVADQQLAAARANFASAAEERKAKAEKARAERIAKEAAEAQRRAEEAAVQLDIGTLERQVGTVEGTNKVFVDLVDPILKQSVVRVFGPSEKEAAPAETPAPPGAATAYTVAGASLPRKDLGVA